MNTMETQLFTKIILGTATEQDFRKVSDNFFVLAEVFSGNEDMFEDFGVTLSVNYIPDIDSDITLYTEGGTKVIYEVTNHSPDGTYYVSQVTYGRNSN